MWRKLAMSTAVVVLLAGCGTTAHSAHTAARPIWCPTRIDQYKPAQVPSHLGIPNEKVAGSFNARAIVGMTVSTATSYVERRGCTLRVVEEPGKTIMLLTNVVQNRVDVEVVNGRVTAAGVY